MEGVGTRSRPVVTDKDQNPMIQAITWFLFAATALVLCFRLLTRFWLREARNFALEDALILCAFAFGVGEFFTILNSKSNLIGASLEGASPERLAAALKAQYAGQLLFVISMFFAKLSVCATLLSLSPFHKFTTYSIGGGIAIWFLTSIFVLALQCDLPDPWLYTDRVCRDRHAIQLYVAITNMITDLALVVFPFFIVWPVQMALSRRLAILGLFAVRIFTIGATGAQISFIHTLFAPDFMLASTPYFICMQIVQCASVASACIAYLWPFLKSLQSGLMWTNNTSSQKGSTFGSLFKSSGQDSGTHNNRSQEDRNKYIEITLQSTVRSEEAGAADATNGTSPTHQYRNEW